MQINEVHPTMSHKLYFTKEAQNKEYMRKASIYMKYQRRQN